MHRSGDDPVKAMSRYIAGFAQGVVQDQLGTQPPCRSYRHLMCFFEFDKVITELKAARANAQIQQINNHYKVFKAAFTDLVAMANAAAVRLAMKIKKLKEQKKASRATKERSVAAKKAADARPSAAKKAAKTHILQSLEGVATDITSGSAGNLCCDSLKAALSNQVPHVLRLSGEEAQIGPETDMMKVATGLADKFAQSKEHEDPGRAQRGFKSAGDPIQTWLMSQLIEGHAMAMGEGSPEILVKVMAPVSFAIAKNRETSSAETGHLPTMRLILRGSRQCMMAPTAVLWKYLSTTLGISGLNPKKVYGWLKSATVESLKAFVQAHEGQLVLVGATFHPNDVLIVPGGWCFYEKIGSADLLGVKCQFVAAAAATTLSELNRMVLGSKETNAHLQSANDIIALKS